MSDSLVPDRGPGGSVCYARSAVAPLVLLTDHSVPDVLPALPATGHDVKVEPLAAAPRHLLDLSALAFVIDAVSDPERAMDVARAARTWRPPITILMVVGPGDLERLPWAEVADDVILTDASAAEIRLRLELVARRTGEGGEGAIRLGPLTLNVDSYQVAVSGRLLDLTYKEFELLRFLVRAPGRVFTRDALLRQVWGYDFYGGTRTVDVHVRRLRAKLGPEHETLIQTVRGVGYRAAEPEAVRRDHQDRDRRPEV
jgi:DNA-binding response OmpR family regulator